MEGRHGENLGFSFQVTTAVRQRSEYFTPSWTAELLRKILKFVYSVYTRKHARIVTPVVVNVLTCTPKFEECRSATPPELTGRRCLLVAGRWHGLVAVRCSRLACTCNSLLPTKLRPDILPVPGLLQQYWLHPYLSE